MMNPTSRLILPAAVLGALACGPSTPPPTSSGSGDVLSLSASTATAPATTASAAPADTASAAPAASSAPAKPARPPASPGGPMAVTENDKEVSAPYGPRGGISRLLSTGAELTVPREAVPESLGFTFAANTGKNMLKITPYKGQIGDVYRVFVFRESDSGVGVSTTSASSPFLVKLPLKGAKTANLVIGSTADGKAAKYTIIAPKSVLEAEGGANAAIFELPTLPGEAILHLTSLAPTP